MELYAGAFKSTEIYMLEKRNVLNSSRAQDSFMQHSDLLSYIPVVLCQGNVLQREVHTFY